VRTRRAFISLLGGAGRHRPRWTVGHLPPYASAQMTDQRTNHTLGIDPIRLRPPCPPTHLQAGRIENVVVNAVSFEHAMQPKPIIACLVARYYLDWSAQLPAHPHANPLNQLD